MSVSWIPNAVTLLRIAAAPFVGWLIWAAPHQESHDASADYYLIAFVLFSLACITDWLDGFLARALNATSDFGAKIDLWADKIIVASVLLGALGTGPFWAIFGLLSLTIRDLYIMRLRHQNPSVNLKATFLAKSKTAIVMVGMAVAILGAYGIENALASEISDEFIILLYAGLGTFALGCLLSLFTGWLYVAAARQANSTSSQ